VLIHTRYAAHPQYSAVVNDDNDRFASRPIDERRQAALPSCPGLAARRSARARTALVFLELARDCLPVDGITINDPIRLTMTRGHNVGLAAGAAGLPESRCCATRKARSSGRSKSIHWISDQPRVR
jgi:primosomal protein N' (replication factor Y)